MAGFAPAPAGKATPTEIPIEIDGGIASLEQSRHHPNAALKAVNDLTKALEAPGASTSAEMGNKVNPGASNGLLIKGLLD
jgi:hypothetical protein